MQSNNDVIVISTDISKAYNNRLAFVTHSMWPCKSAVALLPVTVILGLRLKEGPMEDNTELWKREIRVGKETSGKKIRHLCGGEILISWEGRLRKEENKSMKSKSSYRNTEI